MPQVWDVEVGRVVEFTYHGKPRFVKVESLEKGGSVMKGWDYNADHPTGGWRSFLRDEVVGTPYEVIQVR